MTSFMKKLRQMLGADSQPGIGRLTATPIQDDVAEDVKRAAYPAYSSELLAALTERSVAELVAAGALPLHPEASRSDAWTLERLEALRTDASRAREQRAAARIAADEASRYLASLAKPAGPLARVALFLFTILVGATGIAAVALLVTQSADVYLLRAYVAGVMQADAELYSAYAALCLSALCAATVLGGQLYAVLASRGRLHSGYKLAFVLVDVCFAGGLAVMRLGDEFSWQAVSVSIFEFAVSAACTVTLLSLAQVLRRDAERAEPYEVAERELARAEKAERQSVETLAAAEGLLVSHVRELGAREDAVRREGRLRELAKASVAAEYMVTTSALIGEDARNASSEALMEGIERHLGHDLEREGVRRART